MIKVIERTALDGRIKKLLQGMKCELRYGKTRVYNEDERRELLSVTVQADRMIKCKDFKAGLSVWGRERNQGGRNTLNEVSL